MRLINKIDRYLEDKQYQIIIKDKKINILNYDEIIDFSSNKIILKCNEQKIIIEGKNLIILKMLDEEILITGIVFNIGIN
jgi:sporulation protein YqfC